MIFLITNTVAVYIGEVGDTEDQLVSKASFNFLFIIPVNPKISNANINSKSTL